MVIQANNRTVFTQGMNFVLEVNVRSN